MKKLLAKIRKILKDRRTRQLLTRIVSITAAIVVFITTYALVLPAITMESEANCGIPAHQHDDSCYEDRLICGQVESPGHQHTDACYSISKSLICTETEHQHDDSCFDEDGNLTCELAEHTHDDACYEEVRELVCNIPESEGHEHTADCYERVLACGMEAHTHSTACYSHGSDLTASAPSDFAAVATTELGSYGATVSASAETQANPEETSNTWASDESAAGGLSSAAADTTDSVAADYSSTAAAAGTASTGFDAATAEDAFVPQLEPIFFEQILTKDTGIYYYHAEEDEEVPENSADIAAWKRVDNDTELVPADLLRVYLRYTIPAGVLNATNDIARYRLPSNLHLTDQQMEAINTTVNGIANQYVNLDTLEITDTERYSTYLGIEATEGTRKPSDNIDEYFTNHPDLEGQEYINAVVRAENVFDETTEEYMGQDLVFTFTPYTVQKNQHEYDAEGQPTKAGQKVNGWLCFDLHMDQIDWSEPVISTIEDPAAPAQDVTIENTEDTNSADTTEATEKAASDMDEDASLSSSNPDALNTNTTTEKKDSFAEIVFAAKDKTLKIDEISTELHQVELNTIEKENDTAQDEPDQSADDSTDNANSEMTDGKDDTADDTNPEGETDKSDSADESAADTENQPESAMEINAETYPAVSFEDTITVQAGTLSTDNENAAKETPAETAITVSVIAEEETFPLGTSMQLGTVEDLDTVASAVEGAVEGQTRGFHAVDISFHNADGEEIEPLKPIKVSMTSDAIKQAVEDSSTVPVVMHVENPADSTAADSATTDSAFTTHTDDDTVADNIPTGNSGAPSQTEASTSTPTATIVESNETSSTENSADKKDTADTLSFDASAFSVYTIVYTVDFYWDVDGKTYDFCIPGGGFVSLEHLVEVLGISDTESVSADTMTDNMKATDSTQVTEETNRFDDAIKLNKIEPSETAKKIVADVESVEFSTPELVWVGKVNETTTVGSLKKANNLEIEYSSNLTKEQIEKINAQTVEIGDWALISVRPFTSEETLTITMTNGDQFIVKVTDAQISTHVITADGNDYIITVTYGQEAGIPDGTELKAEEIIAGTREYDEYYQDAWEAIQPAPINDSNNDLNEESVFSLEENIMAKLLKPESDIAFIRLFDISLIYKGKEMEPAAPVKVTISYADAIEIDETKEATAVHFVKNTDAEVLNVQTEKNNKSEDILEKRGTEADNNKDAVNEIKKFEFTQTSFSVTATIVKENNNVLPNGSYVILMHDTNWYALNGNGGTTPTNNYSNGDSYDLDENLVWTIKRNNNGTYSIKNGNKYLVLNGSSITSNTDVGIAVNLSTSGSYQRAAFNNGSDYLEWDRDSNVFYVFNGQDQHPQTYYLARAAVDNIEVTATRRDDQLHYIITDHYGNADKDHTNNAVVRENGYLSPGASLTFDKDVSSSQTYAGVTVTAGHDAVNIGQNGHITITNNDKNVHVVHIDYYYKDPQISTSTITFDRSQDKYDTKYIGNTKYYDLNDERIHTDKTATVVEDGDGRSFNITLDTWNVGWNISTIGMVLDASGSMAWDSAPGHKLSVNGNYTPYKFLSPSELNKILCIDYSDYSVAGYGDYTYYVYEQGNNVNEYAPLGYFKGNATGNENGKNRYAYVDASGSTKFAHLSNYNGAGWYYVNTTDASHFNYIGGAKQYLGINTNDSSINNAQSTAGTSQTVNFFRGNDISDWCVDGDTRYRQTTDYNKGKGNTPPQFYIDKDGYLRCFFYHSKSIKDSYVYAKQDNEVIKTELLQDAIGCFAGTLHSIAPTSAIGMTRFSRANNTASNGFDTDKLTLLNWTTNTESIIGALNIAYGGQNLATGSTTDNGLTVYNYGLTGHTSTQSGLSAFNTYLDGNNALNAWARQYAKNTGTSWNPHYEFDKYVVIFTDGKDTDQDDNTYKTYAKTQADTLKAQGYTVITVLLVPADAMDQNGTITDASFQQARTFLSTLNGNQDPNKNAWANEVFVANAADSNALRDHFVQIAEKIAKTLEGYTIRDYIDPRFALVDENDVPISIGEHPELGFTLYYDATRDMQYVEWTNQKIPTNLKQDSASTENGQPVEMSLWSQTIRVRAKDDFLGGNKVLSNANVEELNKVYPDGDPNNNNPNISRTFPRTTVDPQVLELDLGTAEDTIYLGETIGATEHNKLENEIGNTVDETWYYEYLDRYGVATNTDYITRLQQGDEVTIPYYYFPDNTEKNAFDAAVLSPNNKKSYIKDQIGTLKYRWIPCDANGNEISIPNAYNYLTTNTDDIYYRLKIEYTPFTVNQRTPEVNKMIDSDDFNRPVKEHVGTPQMKVESALNEGIATVHIVSGQIQVEKKVNKNDLLSYFESTGTNNVKFTFSMTRNYNNEDQTYPSLSTDYADPNGYKGYKYPETISVTISKAETQTTIADPSGNITVNGTLLEKLPIGTYTLSENDNTSFELQSISVIDLTQDQLSAKATGGVATGIIELGKEDSSAIGISTVIDVETPYVTIPEKSKKYLYAQKAELLFLNEVKPPLIIVKVDSTNPSKKIGGAGFSLYGSEDFDEGTKKPKPGKTPVIGTTEAQGSQLGMAQMGNLANGTYYLIEDGIPSGYNNPEYSYIKLIYNGTTVTYSTDIVSGISGSVAKETRNGVTGYFLQVENSPGVELPASGGSGTALFYLLGFLITVLAGIGLALQKHEKNLV